MRKLALLLLFIIITQPNILGQIGVTQFPKIGFGDFNLIARHPMYCGGTNNTAVHQQYISKFYYFPQLRDLGLTHLVTGADAATTLNSNYNNTSPIKIMDMNFSWDVTDYPGAYSAVYAFSHAEGNTDLRVEYQLGGDRTTNVNPDENVSNYGFGEFSQSNFWMMQFGDPISPDIYNNATGANLQDPFFHFRKADTSLHPAGYLFWGLTNPLHQAVPWVGSINPSTYDFVLNMKISGSNYDQLDTVLIVKIKPDLNYFVEADPNSPNYIQNLQRDSVNKPAPTVLWDTLFVIRVQDVSTVGFEPVILRNIRPPISRDHGLQITAYWPKKVDVMIDKITYHNKFYDSLFLAAPSIKQAKESAITSSLNHYYNLKTTDSTLYENLYEDEPTFMRSRALKKLNQLALNIDNSGNFHINGATGAYPEYYLRFSREFELDENSTNREFKPYLLFNYYPFDGYTDTTEQNVQANLDSLIQFQYIHDQLGTYPYQKTGLLNAIRASQNTFDLSSTNVSLLDDRHFFHTIQVHGEYSINGSGGLHIDGNSRREPTPDEIKVQAYLALAYGAKGIMYYMIPTNTHDGSAYRTLINTYGLFDASTGEIFNSQAQTGLIQNPADEQVPNRRFYAVKSLNEELTNIEDDLLKLTWVNGYSCHIAGPKIKFLDNLVAKDTTGVPDAQIQTYVELGVFKEYVDKFDYSLGVKENTDYFMIVNRRCNMPGSTRDIQITIECPDTSFKQWKLTDLSENKDTIFSLSGSNFQIQHRYSPGTGKLFKLQPVLISGGVVTVNENVSKDIIVEADVTISNNATLTVQPGKTLEFRNNAKLILIGGGKLKAIGTTNSKITFDFVSKNWTAGNGILNYNKSAVIKNALIKNSAVGFYSYYSEGDTLENVEITQCYFGISLYNSYNNGDDKTLIINSNIHNNSTRGITMTASRPRIMGNTITENDIGIFCANLSQPSLGEIERYGYNSISDNNIGLYSTHSFPYLGLVGGGGDSTLFGGHNQLTNTEYNVIATNTSAVYAHLSWWGSQDPSEFMLELGSTFDIIEYDYYLERPPFNNMNLTSYAKGTDNLLRPNLSESDPEIEDIGYSLTNIDNLIKIIFKMLKAKNIKGAFEFCSKIIRDNPDSIKTLQLTMLLSKIASLENPDLFSEFINNLNLGSNHRIKNFSKLLTLPYEPEAKMTVLNELLSSENDSIIELSALHLLALEKFYSFHDKTGSSLVLQKMKTKYPGNSLTQDLELMLSDTLQIKGLNKPIGSTIASNTENLANEYKLIGNYPNPFNPETKIVFNLKERSSVQVTVFDILGRELFTDILGELNSGIGEHGININGKNLSSGVYLYRFAAESIETVGLKYSQVSKFVILK
ncbi:MAG: T9SS type A sorting domain-containing protein [Ignavibacteriaceae bacterium]|nr:T9SS type A sorting domain-containing protein [Ignavibacteriaceae bacterium]